MQRLFLAVLLVSATALAGCTSAMFAASPTANSVPRQLNLNPGTAGMDCAIDRDGNPVDVGNDAKC